MINTPVEIKQELKEKGFLKIIDLDGKYKTIDYKWLDTKFKTFQKSKPWIFDEESGDCDDAAMELFVDLKKAARKARAFKGFGVPIALVIVTLSVTSQFSTKGDRTRHMTIIAKCSNGKWVLYEKTNNTLYDLADLLDRMEFSVLEFAMF